MKNLMQLGVLKDFQTKYPTSHVGGSIGLMLRGVNLHRDLSKSDLDITIDQLEKVDESYDERSDSNDFDFCVQKELKSGHYVKIDIRVNPEPSFDIVRFEGETYNVSKERDILFWKRKYADKKVQKHIDDLYAIENNKRPQVAVDLTDDLPF